MDIQRGKEVRRNRIIKRTIVIALAASVLSAGGYKLYRMQPDTILMELDNPELKQQTLDAEYTLKAAEAGYTDLAVQLKTQLFDKKSAAAQVVSDYKEAAMHADRDQKLQKEGLLPDLDAQISANKAEQLKIRNDLEEQRLKIIDESAQAQLAAQR